MSDPQLSIVDDAITLDSARKCFCGRISGVDADPCEIERLAGLGLCAGRQFELIQCGDPMILRIYGTKIGLASRLARRIRFEPIGETPQIKLEPAYATN